MESEIGQLSLEKLLTGQDLRTHCNMLIWHPDLPGIEGQTDFYA